MSSKAAFIQTVYEKVNDILGNDTQLFMMEFPARGLNPADFEYSTEHRTSAITKPFSVREKEFRLTDDLFNVGRITGGPTGEKLSSVYESIVNNYVPRLDSYVAFARDKVVARRWLVEEVAFTKSDGTTTRRSRIAFCEELMERYLDAKLAWEKEKKSKFAELKNSATALAATDPKGSTERLNAAMDEYADWISTMGLIRDEKLNQLYNDVVVRGNLHEVLTFLGFLNAASTSEILESTKQFMRNSARLSVDGASRIYPVNLSPSNWFQALRPNFSPKDLTMSREALAAQYRSKNKMLADLQQQKAELETMHVSPRQIDDITGRVTVAETAAREAEQTFLQSQTQAILNAAKIAYSAYSIGLAGATDVLSAPDAPALDTGTPSADQAPRKGQAAKSRLETADENTNPKKVFNNRLQALSSVVLDPKQMDAIFDGVTKVSSALSQALEAKSKLSGLMAKEAMLKSHNFQAQLQKLSAQIDILTSDIQYLEPLVAGAISVYQTDKATIKNNPGLDEWLKNEDSTLWEKVKGDNEKIDQSRYDALPKEEKATVDVLRKKHTDEVATIEKPLLPNQDLNVSDLSFTDVIISSSDVRNTSTKDTTAQASDTSVQVAGWFANFNYSNSQSSAQTDFENNAFQSQFECGFRIAKVTIDRGGWFNPSILKMSDAFYKLADFRAGAGITPDDMSGENNPDWQKVLNGKLKKSLLPAYPVAFVIAKDITFKLAITETTSSGSNKNKSEKGAVGGGFGPFSASMASSSSSTSESAYSGTHGSNQYIRIPGPQILGWYLQFTPEDNSTSYVGQSNGNGQGVLDILTLNDELMLNQIKVRRHELESGSKPLLEAVVTKNGVASEV